MRKSQATPTWIALFSVFLLCAPACGPDSSDDAGDAGPPPSGMLSGPSEACVGDHASFTLRYPAGTGSGSTTLYDWWITSNVATAAGNGGVTVNPGYGEVIQVDCLDAGRVTLRARGPGGDSLSESFQCVFCG